MADRERTQSSKREMDERSRREAGGTATSGSRGEEREHGVRNLGSVGRDIADQSKERNTEIAVEAGHKRPGERHDGKR